MNTRYSAPCRARYVLGQLKTMDDKFAFLESSGGAYLLGRRLTTIDLSMFQLVAGLRYAFPKRMKVFEKKIPELIELHDRIAARPKIAVAVKLENPPSAVFSDMKRSMRTNTLGQSVDTICGRVKGKKTSGEDIGDRPFLYLVKDNVAFVADDSPSSADSTAHSAICN